MIKLDIKPLSVNEAWQGRRFRTPKYKKFQKDIKFLLPKLKEDFSGKLRVNIKYGFSSKLSDLDNPTKLVLDSLVKKYGFDDRQIYELYQEKEIVKKGQDYIAFEIIKL